MSHTEDNLYLAENMVCVLVFKELNLTCYEQWLLTCQVIVVDWNKQATKFHPQNALILKKWKGADDDTALLDLANLLQSKFFYQTW